MSIRKIFVVVFILTSTVCVSQDKFNVVCQDFTFDQKPYTQGKNLRNIFEVVITENRYPFKLVSREKMDELFQTLQEEKNLAKDLSSELKSKLQLASVDYLVIGDLNENIGTDKYTLIINFIKIAGKNVTEKLPMLLTFNRTDFSDNEIIKNIFEKEIASFVKTYFVVTSEDSLVTIPEFYTQLKIRDSIIASHDSTIKALNDNDKLKNQTINNLSNSITSLQKDNVLKDSEINKLTNDVGNIRDYSNIAKLGLFGEIIHYAPPLIAPHNKLYDLMDSILEKKGNQIIVRQTDSTLMLINEVIKEYPKFPFGYFAKGMYLINNRGNEALLYLEKAIDILRITTRIDGHNSDHDLILNYIINSILKPAGINY